MKRTRLGWCGSLWLAALSLIMVASAAEASHWRFGHVTWQRTADLADDPRAVEITVLEGYRSSFIGSNVYSFGDASSFSTSGAVTVATGTDLAGEQFTIRRTVVTHTYASDGPFTVAFSSCCRIGSIVNPSSGQRVEAVVDLSGGNQGSPVSTIPPILQMEVNALNVVPLTIGDPDGDPFSCRMATASESSILAVPAATNTLSVSSGCVLEWDTAGTAVAQKYAAQVVIEENTGGGGRVALDFIIEIVADLGEAPECTLNGTASNVVPVGTPFSISTTGSDLDGDDLTVNHLGLPTGATLSPPAGTTQAEPFTATFAWTPGAGDAGSISAVTITYTDTTGLQDSCSFTIEVPINQPPVCDANGEYVAECQGTTTAIQLDASASFDPDPLDVLAFSWSSSCAGASFDDASLESPILTVDSSAPPVDCDVDLSVSDGMESDSCTTTVLVEDTTAPMIQCNAPPTIVPPDAPISFTAGGADACGSATATIVGFDCFMFTKKGKRIDKRESCEIAIHGDTITILDSGGVDDHISWIVVIEDESGNTAQGQCEVLVVNPGNKP